MTKKPVADDGVEQILDETVDIAAYAARGEKPPLAKGYKIKINGEVIIIEKPTITGREVLTLGGLIPPEEYTLRLKVAGQKPKKVSLDEVVDLRTPGIEKFKALPADQTEG